MRVGEPRDQKLVANVGSIGIVDGMVRPQPDDHDAIAIGEYVSGLNAGAALSELGRGAVIQQDFGAAKARHSLFRFSRFKSDTQLAWSLLVREC